MSRRRFQTICGCLGAAVFLVMALELGAAAAGGPDAFAARGRLLVTAWFFTAPVVVGLYAALFWLQRLSDQRTAPVARARRDPDSRERATLAAIYGALLVLVAGGLFVYGAVAGSALFTSPGTVAALLYRHLGEPLWALFGLVLITSAAFAFALGTVSFLRASVLQRQPALALGVGGLLALVLWSVALNGLGVFVTGEALAHI